MTLLAGDHSQWIGRIERHDELCFPRLASPLDTAAFTLCGLPAGTDAAARLWTRDAEVAITMDATATWS